MSFQALFPGVILATCVAFAALILRRNRRDPASRVFLLILCLFALFGLVYLPGRLGFHSEEVQTFYLYGNALVFPFLTAALLHFSLLYPRRSPVLEHRAALPLLYLPAAAFVLSVLYDIRLYAADVDVLPGYDQFYTTLGPLGPLFFAVVIGPALLAVGRLGAARGRAASSVEARILTILLAGIGTLVAFSTVTAAARIFAGVHLRVGESEVAMVPVATIAYAILRHGLLIAPVLEDPSDRPRRFLAEPGSCLLIAAPGHAGFDLFGELATHGAPGAVFTRLPSGLRAGDHGLKRTPFYWLGRWPGHQLPVGYTGIVGDMGDLIHTAIDFMAGVPGAVVIVDDVAPLAERRGFRAVRHMAVRLRDAARKHGCFFLLRVDPRLLEGEQVAWLEREMVRGRPPRAAEA